MITPDAFFSNIGPYQMPYKLDFTMPKDLGSGGIKFKSVSPMIIIEGRQVELNIIGRFIKAVGPFKNDLDCKINVAVYPTDLDSRDGYTFTCLYSKTMWGKCYTEDIEKLVKKLVSMLRDHFRYDQSGKFINQGGEQITLAFFKELDHYHCGIVYLNSMTARI